MTKSAITRRLLEQVDQLPLELQHKVLDFARALVLAQPREVPGQSLLRFAGAVPADDLKAMSEAINADCEQAEE